MNEILFYGFVSEFSVASFILSLTSAKTANRDVFVKINSGGGDVFAGWGAIAEFRAFPNGKKVIVHGNASSMMAYFLLFVQEPEAIQQSKFVFHRASNFFESEESIKLQLDSINIDLRKALEEKLDVEAFVAIMKEQNGEEVDLDRFFDANERPIDVTLNADQAKAIGLIKNVVNLSANEAESINENLMAASTGQGISLIQVEQPEATTEDKILEPNKIVKMDLAELKSKHPDLVAKLLAEQAEANTAAVKSATTAELDRVKSWMVFQEINPKAVKEGIESGVAPTQAQTSEFLLAGAKQGFAASAEAGNAGDVDTPEAEGELSKEDKAKKDKQDKIDAFEAKVKAKIQ